METLEGNFSQQGLWKIKNKLAPCTSDPPMANFNNEGQLPITITLPLLEFIP